MADFRAILVSSGLLPEKPGGPTGHSGHTRTNDNLDNSLEYSWPVTSSKSAVVPLVTARRHAEFPVTSANTRVVTANRYQNTKQKQDLINPVTSGTTVTTEIDVSPQIDEEERAAIAIELGGVPTIYASAFAQLQTHAPPEVPEHRWYQFINDAGIFLDQWSREADRLGWTAEDLFGLHPDVPMARYDRMGLVWMLKGKHVVALTATKARFSGGLSFYRRNRE